MPETLPGKRHPRTGLQICPLPPVPLSFPDGGSKPLGIAYPLDGTGSPPAPGVLACVDEDERRVELWVLTAAKLTLWRVRGCLKKISARLLSPGSHSFERM